MWLEPFDRNRFPLVGSFCPSFGCLVQYHLGRLGTAGDGLSVKPNEFSKRRREKAPHWQCWTTGNNYKRWRQAINSVQRYGQHCTLWVVRWSWSHFRLLHPSRDVDAPVLHTTMTTEKVVGYTDRASNRSQSGLMTTVNTGRLRGTVKNLRAASTTSDHAIQDYVGVIVVVVALQQEISTLKVCMGTGHDSPK